MIFLIWLAVILLATIYLYCRHVFSVFKAAGVKHNPPLPLVGNMTQTLFRTEHFTEAVAKLYFPFPGERFVGKFEFMNPVICIRDPELLKKITVKDFEHFGNHRSIVNDQADPMLGRNLFLMRGQDWKEMRYTLTPTFTSSKIRLMIPFMMDVGDQMIKALKSKIEQSKVNSIDVDIRDLTTRFASDVVASCTFGLTVDSYKDTDNFFYVNGREASVFSYRQLLIIFGYTVFPKLMKALNITITSNASKVFFRNLVKNTMQNRKDQHIIRPDMIHLLMETKKVWSDDDLVAQAVVFFFAGSEPMSITMSFLLHELALNPDIQARLVEEIRENDDKNGGKFDYNSVQSMVYLDMVISEVLRLWPAAISIDRTCTKDYNAGKPNTNSTEDFIIRKGSMVSIPVWGLHHDPQYFPDPMKFDPERFSEKNKRNIKPFTFIPFGAGPRNCIGYRFAVYEIKVMTYQLLRNMEVSRCEKTCVPSRLDKKSFQVKLQGGHWLKIKPRV